MLDTFHVETLKVNESLKIFFSENDYVELKLVQANKSNFENASDFREGFSWIFTTPIGVSLEAGTYKVYHETLGEFELGLTPIVPPIGEVEFAYYEACFN